MKRIISMAIMAAAAAILSISAGAAKPQKLQLREDGTFKIMQFTDLHFKTHTPDENAKVLKRIESMTELEHPDFIVVTGDLVFTDQAGPMLQSIIDKLDSTGVPWCILYGNHDAEQDLTRPQMSSMVTSGKLSVNTLNKAGELADMELAVCDGKDALLYLYLMDSHDYSTMEGVGGYAWLTRQQVDWLRESCLARTDKDGKVAPSFAFFHIPLPEYRDAWEQGKHVGIKAESVCAPQINSGMFAAMVETRSVKGVFAGHDHNNDFVALWQGIALCYGRYSGGNTVYNDIPRGARVIRFNKNKEGFETWTRDDEGRALGHVFVTGKDLIKGKKNLDGKYSLWYELDED